jgi:hypothetical protein
MMRIEYAIRRVHSLPDSWVRVEQINAIPAGLELCLSVYKGKRGRKTEGWRIGCLGVREFQVSELNGGGLRIYAANHPAARQYVTRRAVLRWTGGDEARTIKSLCQAHMDAVDDWIPIDRYLDIRAIAGGNYICRGPDFLMRAYAKALRLNGVKPRLRVRERRKANSVRPRVLHFGESFVVATAFNAQPQDVASRPVR